MSKLLLKKNIFGSTSDISQLPSRCGSAAWNHAQTVWLQHNPVSCQCMPQTEQYKCTTVQDSWQRHSHRNQMQQRIIWFWKKPYAVSQRKGSEVFRVGCAVPWLAVTWPNLPEARGAILSPQSFSTRKLLPQNVMGSWGTQHHLWSSALSCWAKHKLWLETSESEKAATEHEETALVKATEGPNYIQKTWQASAGKQQDLSAFSALMLRHNYFWVSKSCD